MRSAGLVMLLIATIAAGCGDVMDAMGLDGSSASPGATPGVSVVLGKRFSLEIGQTARLDDGLTVTFDSVVGDSRCPEGAECVWEGDAEIAVGAAMTGEDPAVLRLHTNPGFDTMATYLAFTIKLVSLDPYPDVNVEPDGSYDATLVVKAGDSR